jgi:L-histidine N-alpha-methyltransferase
MPRSAASPLTDAATSPAAAEIADWLTRTPRQLPSHYLYDRLGSALFEAICHLPWYRIASTERRLLETHAAEINERAGAVAAFAELGPGSGEKLRTLLAARLRGSVDVHLIDVSVEALEQASTALATMRGLTVAAMRATYSDGLARLDFGSVQGPVLVAFLGSNIGNFDRAVAERLLREIRARLRSGDALLLGTDLVKPERDLQLAYDDPLGVTAAFNRNLLVRLNRELGADFDVGGFAHRAVWNAEAGRMEMHLVSTRAQRVRVADAGLDLAFAAGESIWTESSYKYRAADLEALLSPSGFAVRRQWVEDGFALTLAGAV